MGRATLTRPRIALRGLLVAGGAGVIAGSFLPWVASGDVQRSSYELFELVDRLGYAPDGPVATAVRWWPLVPFLVAAAVSAAMWGRHRTAIVAAGVASGYPLAVGAAVVLAPSLDPLRVVAGPPVTMAGAIVLLGATVATVAVDRRDPLSPRPTRGARGARPSAPPAGRS